MIYNLDRQIIKSKSWLLKVRHINTIMKKAYKSWDEKKYRGWLQEFQIDNRKLIKDYSKGMTMKLSLAVALSHDSKILILDEATSGLDPIVRSQVLDVFVRFVSNFCSILISCRIYNKKDLD